MKPRSTVLRGFVKLETAPVSMREPSDPALNRNQQFAQGAPTVARPT
jgi:hypothetical protein